MTDGVAFPPQRLLIAVGGNAIHPGDISGTVEEQRTIAARTATALLPVMRLGCQLVITHGNGPVVGKILMRQAIARNRVAPMSLDICVAHSQGGIAYLLMQALENALRRAGDRRDVVCLLTQVEVDPDDPAFAKPSKPVGFFFDREEALDVGHKLGWTMAEDAGRGWRHVVPSPKPLRVVDAALIDAVCSGGAVVIAGGGGGIPVVLDPDGSRRGIEAVIDKDLCSALLAEVLGVDTLLILTAVPQVAINFGKPDQRGLSRVTAAELRRLQAEGQFAAGSMGPKVAAAVDFVSGAERGQRRAIIAHLFEAEQALRGAAGTQVIA